LRLQKPQDIADPSCLVPFAPEYRSFASIFPSNSESHGRSGVVGRQHRDRLVMALPRAAVLPLPREIDALSGRQASDIERGDVKAEAAFAGRLVRDVMPAFPSPMHDGRAGQRDREPRSGMKTVDRRMRPPERNSRRRTAAPLALPCGARPVERMPE